MTAVKCGEKGLGGLKITAGTVRTIPHGCSFFRNKDLFMEPLGETSQTEHPHIACGRPSLLMLGN